MNYIKILNQNEKNKIINQLNEQFGIENIPGTLVKIGKERLMLFTGSLSEKEIENLSEITNIEGIGVYFAKIDERTGDIRLSIEGSQILSKQITKNIFELNSDEQVEQWMSGQDLQIKTGKRDFLIVKYKDDFLGSGKACENKIGNFIPKARRLILKG